MDEMVTVKLPKRDIEALMRIVEDIEFLGEAEKGDKEIEKGNFKTLEDAKKKYGVQ